MVAEDNEVGASERWTGIEPAQLADWTVDGSALLMVIDLMITYMEFDDTRYELRWRNTPH